jgi:uncharacterized membrane protein YccC
MMRAITRALSAAARFANDRPRVVLLVLLAIVGVVFGLAIFGAVSLFQPPVLPKALLLAAIVTAALVAMARPAK